MGISTEWDPRRPDSALAVTLLGGDDVLVKPAAERHEASTPAQFPVVAGRTLLGVRLVLPADLPADRTLVVLAFQRWQQARANRWIGRAFAAGIPATTRGETGPVPVAVVEARSLRPMAGRLWVSSTSRPGGDSAVDTPEG